MDVFLQLNPIPENYAHAAELVSASAFKIFTRYHTGNASTTYFPSIYI